MLVAISANRVLERLFLQNIPLVRWGGLTLPSDYDCPIGDLITVELRGDR